LVVCYLLQRSVHGSGECFGFHIDLDVSSIWKEQMNFCVVTFSNKVHTWNSNTAFSDKGTDFDTVIITGKN